LARWHDGGIGVYHAGKMILSHPRYTDIALPEYRFVPGEQPHPIRDPAGHSYLPPGAPPPSVAYKRAHRWRDCPAYLYGCDLYNHGYWWEAHETWEGLWRQATRDGGQRHFLQTLIQVAICHLKLHTGVLGGVRSLRRNSTRHLREAVRRIPMSVFMGVDVKSWHQSVQDYYDRILADASQTPRHDPPRYPYLELTR
jgi:hypothetical protein